MTVAVFEIDVLGEFTGQRYTGDFAVKLIPTLGDRKKIDLVKNSYVSGLTPDSDTYQIYGLIAEIQVLASKMPDWMQGAKIEELADFQPLLEIKQKLEDEREKLLKKD